MKQLLMLVGSLIIPVVGFSDVVKCNSISESKPLSIIANVVTDSLIESVQVTNGEPITWTTRSEANSNYVSENQVFKDFNQFDITESLSVDRYRLLLPKFVGEKTKKRFRAHLQVKQTGTPERVVSFSCGFD